MNLALKYKHYTDDIISSSPSYDQVSRNSFVYFSTQLTLRMNITLDMRNKNMYIEVASISSTISRKKYRISNFNRILYSFPPTKRVDYSTGCWYEYITRFLSTFIHTNTLDNYQQLVKTVHKSLLLVNQRSFHFTTIYIGSTYSVLGIYRWPGKYANRYETLRPALIINRKRSVLILRISRLLLLQLWY